MRLDYCLLQQLDYLDLSLLPILPLAVVNLWNIDHQGRSSLSGTSRAALTSIARTLLFAEVSFVHALCCVVVLFYVHFRRNLCLMDYVNDTS